MPMPAKHQNDRYDRNERCREEDPKRAQRYALSEGEETYKPAAYPTTPYKRAAVSLPNRTTRFVFAVALSAQ